MLEPVPFLSVARQYSIVCTYRPVFPHLSAEEHLGGFHLLPLMNGAAVDVPVEGFTWTYVFISRVYT